MSALITPELVALDKNLGAAPSSVIRRLAELVVGAGRATEIESLYADALAREAKTATGIPGGLAIPHCRSAAVTEPTLALARLSTPVDFGAGDGPADLVFLIAAPAGADQEHLKILAKLSRSLMKPAFTAALRAATTPAEIVELVTNVVSPVPVAVGGGTAAPAASVRTGVKRLVAVTACPTGIAHTYMAAEALSAAAEAAGVEMQVETQGSAGLTMLDPAVIAAADAVIFAVDVDVRGRERFAGKPVIQVPVKRGIDEPAKLIADAIAASENPNARRVGGTAGAAEVDEKNEHFGQKVKRALLTGVSYMIPFVAGGGLLIALGFLLGGYEITKIADVVTLQNSLFNLPDGGLAIYLGAVFFKIGALSMGFLVPALSGYIAYAIADRPGIAPGFVAGAVAGFMGAGFLGGIAGGLLAGVAAASFARLNVPRWLRSLMPVVIIPLVASIVASGLMFLVLGGPIAWLTAALNTWLTGMSGAAAIVLGLILGLMMGFDLGGPVNKVAYAFAVAGLGTATVANQAPWQIMAAVMAAGMVPPLAMALATVLDKKLFSPIERENGKAAWLLGASFISEGAIPFAAADPLRVIPASMLGAGVTGALSMAWGVTSKAPHGGIFVFFAIDSFALFALAIAIGTVVAGLVVIALKRYTTKKVVSGVEAPVLVTA
ncbi:MULTISPECIES: fructose-specific PTS transporter subunit EIIC [unclassified Cryobacterium]|uniref:PTS fructose transporter subunit IIABC n=2 Tax=Cryobacterium TaxID=69578 RepID=UPI002AB5CCA0|nr:MULTISPECIES: fructose-specific PTS transporter subunit EIIC [unclassified Cryobacterium]MDY7528618.1 fructose-specific PTS transporter subunit EIIC [Cryobacterium sp. 10C2]MDY7555643.1 fructose-specific PTS transporter subunit EIIC [Cryobacterium sp. 10C3]MEB0203059.1 fructose-specific PTS transporter subunit EIIC [Cryobacterium sp. 5I3]MEB0285787.1 fructose-specific PTS transporter subunit EIIC [Cryobacterium sp. 10S3]MEB0291069.1 fructose-specific PTS transporter subunit EIIC [Cryobacter